jgi:hypothetical protein
MRLLLMIGLILLPIVLFVALVYVIRQIWIRERKREAWINEIKESLYGKQGSGLFQPHVSNSFSSGIDHSSPCRYEMAEDDSYYQTFSLSLDSREQLLHNDYDK